MKAVQYHEAPSGIEKRITAAWLFDALMKLTSPSVYVEIGDTALTERENKAMRPVILEISSCAANEKILPSKYNTLISKPPVGYCISIMSYSDILRKTVIFRRHSAD